MAEVKIPIDGLSEWLEQETTSLVDPPRAEGKLLLDSVKERLDDIQGNCEKLMRNSEAEMAKDSRKTYRRAKILNKLAKYTLDAIDSVELPDSVSFENLQILCDDLKKILTMVGRERSRWFPRISPYFMLDRRRFDVAFAKATKVLEKLRSFSSNDYEQVKIVEDSFLMVDKLSQSLKELDEVKSRKKEMESRRSTIEKNMNEKQQKTLQIQSRDEVSELAQTNERIATLEDELRHALRRLQKPLFKFQTLIQGPGYPLPPDEAKILREYLTQPFEALSTEDDGYPMLKNLLSKMSDALKKGKLKLKSTRQKKAQTQMDNIIHRDALGSLQKSCKDAFHDKRRLSTSEALTIYREEAAQSGKELARLRKQKQLFDSKASVADDKHKGMLSRIQSEKKELENIVLELTGKNIQITL